MVKKINPELFVGKRMYLDIGRDVLVIVEVQSIQWTFGRYDAQVKVIEALPAEISVKFDNLIPIEEK